MRPLRMAGLVAAAGLAAATLGTLLAVGASLVRKPATRAQMSVCARGVIHAERAAQALGTRPALAFALDRTGRRLWSSRGPETRPLGWAFRPAKPGRYRLVFIESGRRTMLDVLVARCSRELRLGLDGPQRALFTLDNLRPGTTRAACVVVTYTGNRPARLRLYGNTGGTGLDRHLILTVTRGWTAQRSSRSCRTFRADRRDYLGLGMGITYAGTLQGLPDRFTDAPNDATWRSSRTWFRGMSRAYRLEVTLPAAVGNEVQGLTATQAFVWEARPTLRRKRVTGPR